MPAKVTNIHIALPDHCDVDTIVARLDHALAVWGCDTKVHVAGEAQAKGQTTTSATVPGVADVTSDISVTTSAAAEAVTSRKKTTRKRSAKKK